MQMIVSIKDILGDHLMGRTGGRNAFGKLCSAASEAISGQLVVFDFRSVEIVTASWINSALIPFLDWSASDRIDIYPLIVNLSSDAIEEFDFVARHSHRCFLVSGNISKIKTAKLVGSLDQGQKDTLNAVLQFPAITGAELERKFNEPKATAWNNRLKDLYDKRLLRRQKRGREQVYSPIVSEIEFDG